MLWPLANKSDRTRALQVITPQTCFDRSYLDWITNRVSEQNNALQTLSQRLDAVALCKGRMQYDLEIPMSHCHKSRL